MRPYDHELGVSGDRPGQGVGTDLPVARLHVVGKQRWEADNGNVLRLIPGSVHQFDTTGPDHADITFTVGSEVLRLTSDAACGIGGVPDPAQMLELAAGNILLGRTNLLGQTLSRYIGVGDPLGQLAGGGRAAIEFERDGDSFDQSIHFITHQDDASSARRVTIDHIGQVGIGTDTPGSHLHIKGDQANILLDSTGGQWLLNADNNVGRFRLLQSGATRLVMVNGNLGVGDYATPSAKLQVDGDALIEGSLTETSDARLKTDVAPIPDALSRLLKLRGVYYHWKAGARGAARQIGLIAQEVERLFPELVLTTSEGMKSVAYGKLVAILVEALKTQHTRVERLEAAVERLKAAQAEIAELRALKAELLTLKDDLAQSHRTHH